MLDFPHSGFATSMLSDIIGVVQSVSPTLSVRRKSDNEPIPKRDIVIGDER